MTDTLQKDLRYGFRTIVKNPGLTIIIVLSLALGIGANTAIFTVIDAVMLRSLPVRAADELYSVGDSSRPNAVRVGAPMLNIFSYPLYENLRDQNRVFSGLLATGRTGSLEINIGNGAPEEVQGRLVSGNYFEVLGIFPVIGRAISPEDDRRAGANPVAVISFDYWQGRFGGDPAVVGQRIRLNGVPFTIIGVGPLNFQGEVVGIPADIWVPLTIQPILNPADPRLNSYDANWLLCIGRRLPGVSIEQARQNITMLAQQTIVDNYGSKLPADELSEIRSQTVEVRAGSSGFSAMRKQMAQPLFTLMVVVGVLLLIACANVANLQLARSIARRREFAIRLAVGATRLRLIRQLLVESALLAALGGALGFLLAWWGARILLLVGFSGAKNPTPLDVTPNLTVLIFTAAVSLTTAILFGLIPAVTSSRLELHTALKESSRNVQGRGGRIAKSLVVGQLALSLVLLVSSGLFIRNLTNLQSLDVGYSRANLILLKTQLSEGKPASVSEQAAVTDALLQRLGSMPGVIGVTVSENGLFSGTDSTTDELKVEGFTPVRKEDSSAAFDQVGFHFFRVIGAPILSGRDFDEQDRRGSLPVAIINSTMARSFFPNGDPLGKVIINGNDRYTIVGVAKDMKENSLKRKSERRFYIPLSQSEDQISNLNFEIRTLTDASPLIPSVRRELQQFNPNMRILSLEPVKALIDRSISDDRITAQLSGFFGVLALLLVANGVYGLMSYAMSRRTSEIGLRMALGADRLSIVGLVLRETMVLAIAGFLIGLPAAFIAGRLISTALVGIPATDLLTWATAIIVMLAVTLIAALVPAKRAASIDSAVALRKE